MKSLKVFFWLVLLAVSASAQVRGLVVREVDGYPRGIGITEIVVTNSTLTVNGQRATISISGGGGSGTVTSVAQSFTGGLISVAGSPVTTSGTLALTVAGTSGGIPYFSSSSTWASSAALAANALVIGGGAGAAPSTTTTGTGVLTALAVNTGSAGAFVVNGGDAGTPSALVLTNATGLPLSTGVTGDLPFANFVQAGSAGFVGATGAGDYSHRTPAQVTAALDAFVGDSGSGGTKGLVPAPASGDAAAGKVLGAGGTWVAGGGGITVGTTTVTSGTATRLFYETAGNVVGQISGATSDGTNVTFGSGNLMATSPAFTTNQTTTNDAIGTTSTDGIVLQNTTAAAAGAQQYSPRLRLTGQGWKTNATAASQTTDWAIETRPVQGAANPSTNLVVSAQVNGGGYTAIANFLSGGQVAVPLGSSSAPSLTFLTDTNTGFFSFGDQIGYVIGGSLVAITSSTTDVIRLGQGGQVDWSNSANPQSSFGAAGLTSNASAAVRVTNGSTGAGSFIIGTSTVGGVGASGVGVFVMANGTAPTSSPADEFQLYSADSAAGDANAFARNEAGEINRLTGLAARNSSSFAKTSDTTLANITGLTRNVEASRAYAFTAVLQTTAAATGGVKFAVSGTATATSISYEGVLVDSGAIVNQTRATALDTTVCASTTSTAGTCTIRGVVVIANAGTLTLQFAQNASDGGASTVLVNQYMQLIPIS